ncbi:MAG: hypothetical protein M1815_005788 [Lichina confinis]|nr:MAG: hypothetical protein M1815_005788 [Lichina confinis]
MPPKPALTHFLCLPLVTDASRGKLQGSLQQFAAEVSAGGLLQGITNPGKVIRPLGSLHLTVGVMSLAQPDRLEGALALLREVDLNKLMLEAEAACAATPGTPTVSLENPSPTSAGTRPPLTVTLKSVKSWGAAATASVLYTEPLDQTNRLLPFCLELVKTFAAAGFVVPENRPLSLHATLLNTVYAKTASGNEVGVPQDDSAQVDGSSQPGGENQRQTDRRKNRRKTRITVDATDLIKKYDGAVFAEDLQLDRLTICKMGAKPTQDQVLGEEYEVVAARDLEFTTVLPIAVPADDGSKRSQE